LKKREESQQLDAITLLIMLAPKMPPLSNLLKKKEEYLFWNQTILKSYLLPKLIMKFMVKLKIRMIWVEHAVEAVEEKVDLLPLSALLLELELILEEASDSQLLSAESMDSSQHQWESHIMELLFQCHKACVHRQWYYQPLDLCINLQVILRLQWRHYLNHTQKIIGRCRCHSMIKFIKILPLEKES